MAKAKNPAIEPSQNYEPAHNLPKIPNPGLGVVTEKRFNELTLEERKAYFARSEQRWLQRVNNNATQKTTLTRGMG